MGKAKASRIKILPDCCICVLFGPRGKTRESEDIGRWRSLEINKREQTFHFLVKCIYSSYHHVDGHLYQFVLTL